MCTKLLLDIEYGAAVFALERFFFHICHGFIFACHFLFTTPDLIIIFLVWNGLLLVCIFVACNLGLVVGDQLHLLKSILIELVDDIFVRAMLDGTGLIQSFCIVNYVFDNRNISCLSRAKGFIFYSFGDRESESILALTEGVWPTLVYVLEYRLTISERLHSIIYVFSASCYVRQGSLRKRLIAGSGVEAPNKK
jgi:hypothetical protein